MKIKFTIFALLFLQFAESNSMMLRNLARALTVNSRVTSCPRLLLRHYMTEQEKKEAEEKFGAPAEDVEKARLILEEKYFKDKSRMEAWSGILAMGSYLSLGITALPVGELLTCSDARIVKHLIPVSVIMTSYTIGSFLLSVKLAEGSEEKFNPSDIEIKSEVNRLRNRRQINNEN